MGRFRIQLLLLNGQWHSKYINAINNKYGNTSSEWTSLNIDFTEKNSDNKLIYDEIDTAFADMCFSNIMITHSLCWMNHVNIFKDWFESIPDYWKNVVLMFLIKPMLVYYMNVHFWSVILMVIV